MNVSTLVDTFVEKINASPLCFPDYAPDLSPEQTPADGRISRAIEERSVLVEALEEQLKHRLPTSFATLLRRYTWPPFDVADIAFFAWSDDSRHALDDFCHAVFEDEVLSRVLLTHGLVQFGRPDTGHYDAICFDTNHKVGNNEYSIVYVEHENALMYEKIVAHPVASSFHSLMKAFVEA